MKFRIHFTHQDGTEDSFVVSGDDFDEIKQQAHDGVAQRNGVDPWSEELQ